jgi:Ser/Thr protein kinase RdoA (MazF antagonist)/murein DD-endopeptidase MepM/ murein hydrolase activator NlpD
MRLLEHAPRLSVDSAKAVALEQFGVNAKMVSQLPSERDQNFLLATASGERFVLKVSNSLENRAFLDAQQQVLEKLGENLPYCPRLVPSSRTRQLLQSAAVNGATHHLRLVRFLPGTPLGEIRRHSPELLCDFGERLGAMDKVLADFDHPACHRDFHWDLAKAPQTIANTIGRIKSPSVQQAVRQLAHQSEQLVQPLQSRLRRSVIHGDANDYNVLVEGDRVVGIIDFGDMLHSYTVANLAVAAAYVMLDKPDLLAVVAVVVKGYHAAFPLEECEIAALFGLACLRLCLSACMAGLQQEQQPDNDYLAVSQAPLERTLPRLCNIRPRFAEAVFRAACGKTPCPTTDVVTNWLRKNALCMKPILGGGLGLEKSIVLDLSVASPLIDGDQQRNTEPLLTARITSAMNEAGAAVGIGRYNEPRLIYTSALFGLASSPLDEHRTIHLGLDLFCPVGTPIHAPLPGVVHALANNKAALDYGPVLILRHETGDGDLFFTLYGHLGVEVLSLLHVGQPIASGQQIATVGEASVNGGWTPHLHFQIINDLLDLATDFPGVAPASYRSVWLSFAPDPNLIVGIPQDGFPSEPTFAQTLETRRERLGRNLSIAYNKPLKIVRGWMQYLFNDEGRRYLDAYNNVAHVGHCHPRVVQAIQQQAAILNTNTRYLHDLINRFAEQLTATLAAPLTVCYFLNSASEANELALRLARTHTRRQDVIVLESAYHGNTTSLIDISPYKHAGPGGTGAPPWVHVAPLPDGYRGLYKYDDPQIA